MRLLLANLLWFLSCLPRWFLFRVALHHPAAVQRRILARLIRENKDSDFGIAHGFGAIKTPADFAASVPLVDYEAYAQDIETARLTGAYRLASEKPILLEPTSGTSGTHKLIPATATSRREFARAIQPWMADLYVSYPALFFGRQYWVVSPDTPIPESLRGGAIRVGFSDDSEYLGRLGRFVRRNILASSLQDASNLRLISVWHPSYLTAATDGFKDGSTARWPKLRVVSCWTDGNSQLWAERLNDTFHGVSIQGKGLLATEGCISIPFRGKRPCAIRSHYLEFIDVQTQCVHGVAELELCHEYSVVLTTGAGLWRCRLHDKVRVTGFLGATPCLQFLGKDNVVSDLVGEKISEADAAMAIADAISQTGFHPTFAMLVPWQSPDNGQPGYDIVLDFADEQQEQCGKAMAFAAVVEARLCETNYHYLHARRIGQLREVDADVRPGALQTYLLASAKSDTRVGTVKIPALDLTGRAKFHT